MSEHDLIREPLPDPRWGEAFRASRPYAERIVDMGIADYRILPCNRAHRIGLLQSNFACDALLGRSVEKSALVQVSGLREAVQAVCACARAIDEMGQDVKRRRAA